MGILLWSVFLGARTLADTSRGLARNGRSCADTLVRFSTLRNLVSLVAALSAYRRDTESTRLWQFAFPTVYPPSRRGFGVSRIEGTRLRAAAKEETSTLAGRPTLLSPRSIATPGSRKPSSISHRSLLRPEKVAATYTHPYPRILSSHPVTWLATSSLLAHSINRFRKTLAARHEPPSPDNNQTKPPLTHDQAT